nr:DUF4394 domain-containing protein [uncultured Noviherbaspirillum sp.]
MKMKKQWLIAGLLGAALSGQASAAVVYGLTSSNALVMFDSAAPGTIIGSVSVSGLSNGQVIRGIDFRPADGSLYGVSSDSRLYAINTATGAATAVGAAGQFTLDGSAFGFDFNPTVDRIRVTSNTDQNLRLNPNNGGLGATDGILAYASGDVNAGANPNIVGSAYTNSFNGALTTTLYNIDSVLDVLVTQNPPNNGTLNTVGGLGFDTNDNVGFDIIPFSNTALASLTGAGGVSGLYNINLGTGAATSIGAIGSGLTIVDIAVQQVPEPETMALMAIGIFGLLAGRRRLRKGQGG